MKSKRARLESVRDTPAVSHMMRAVVLLLFVGGVCWISGSRFRAMHTGDAIFPGAGLTARKSLSDYGPGLAGTAGDTDVYIFQGERNGAGLLILGGTHPNEPAGFITATLLVENTRAVRGKVVVIPQANRSGFTHNDPFEGNPQRFSISTPEGLRWFRYGSRLTNPVHQWPDSALYVNPSGQKLAGAESRNLNRSYPGRRKGGGLTERVAHALMELIRIEAVDMAVDLHEAAPEYPVINAIVFHPKSAELAAMTMMELELGGLAFRLEESPSSLGGLSHREWGDHAGVFAFLLETANASHGRLKGRPSIALITEGKDPNYVKAARLGLLFVGFDEEGIPLQKRVGRHVAALRALLASWKELFPEKPLDVHGWPDAAAIASTGVGPFLHPPK